MSLTTPDRRAVPFKSWHYDWLREQGAAVEGAAIQELPASWLALLEQHNSGTYVVDGLPVAAAGTIEQWPGRHFAWAYLLPTTAEHMLFFTRAVRQRLDKLKGRIEFTVRCDFEAGHRWAKLLGFEIETPRKRGYGIDGADHAEYVRVN